MLPAHKRPAAPDVGGNHDLRNPTRLFISLLASVGWVRGVGATSGTNQDAQQWIGSSTVVLTGKGCRAVTNIYNTISTDTLRPLVPAEFTLLPSPITKTPIVYLHSLLCESFGVSGPAQQGGFALAAISIQPNGISPPAPRNLYVIHAVTNINRLHEAFRSGGIDSAERTALTLTYPSSTQTILNVGGGTSPFTLTIDGDKPTVPQSFGNNSFNFVGLNKGVQTIFHFDHIESQPGYRGSGTFTGKEGTLIHRLLAAPPTYTALSIPMDFKGSITRTTK